MVQIINLIRGEKVRKVIFILGTLFLSIIIILNILFTANLSASEHIEIKFNNVIYILGVILLAGIIYFITKIIDKKLYNYNDFEQKKHLRKNIFKVILVIYILINIMWIILANPAVVGDSIHVCNLAQTFYRGNPNQFLNSGTYAGITLKQYMQAYPQQITLAFVFSIFFRIIHFDVLEVLRLLNIIGNIAIVISLYKINNQLSKKYKTNKVLLLALILTFIPLVMLITFIYGDTPSLALCLFSVYFVMKYVETKQIKYIVTASLFTMVAYMLRMNTLIFIIATVIYMILNLLQEKTIKEKYLNWLIIILYIIISIMPSSIVKNYYYSKYNLDKSKIYPTQSYLLMAMEESWRGNGWHNEDISKPALYEPEKKKQEYTQKIKDRLIYFSKNLDYTFKFYTMKIASMWAENTYSSVRNNRTKKYTFENIIEPLTFYQKALLILICVCSLIILIQNRKSLSLELIFLITIFIGGFAFHVLWEAKSRYIIPYIIILMPIAAIKINNSTFKHLFFRKKSV